MRKYIKYLVIIFILLFINNCKISAEEGHLWSQDELSTGSFTELKECTYKKSDSYGGAKDEAYVEITSDNKVRQSVGNGVAGEVLNWQRSSNKDYWSGTISFEAKNWYLDNNKCPPIFLKENNDVYLSAWTNFISNYDKLNKPDIYYIVNDNKTSAYDCSYNIKTSEIKGNLNVSYTSNWIPIATSGTVQNVKIDNNDALSKSIEDWKIIISGSTGYNTIVSENNCPIVYLCGLGDSVTYYPNSISYRLYNDSSFLIYDGYTNSKCNHAVCSGGSKCNPDKSKVKLNNGSCATFDIYMDVDDNTSKSINTLAKNYSDCVKNKCTQSKKIKYLNEFNNKLSTLKLYCENLISNNDYLEDDPGCMKKCFDLEKTIHSIEVENGIIGSSNDDCGLTTKITTFLYNIFKWVKYIVPVLVIILSILDFIKAIASSQEEDLKKAQSRFVKRLIVAALLFLLPLIINFMLSTFGLYNKDCDITNMF